MNLGIEGKTALVCGASQGMGFTCAELYAKEGVNLILVSRNEAKLEAAAQKLRDKYSVAVRIIAADLSQREHRARVINEAGEVDILLHNGGWPETDGDYTSWTYEDWQVALDSMMLAPIELINGFVHGMKARGFGRIVAITSRFVKEPQLELSQSVSPRLGLTGYMVGLAREMAPYNVTLNTALPGIIATDTQIQYGKDLAEKQGKTFDQVWHERSQTNSAKRFGTPEEFASLCVYLSSAQAGFLSGQSIVCDGAGYPGVF